MISPQAFNEAMAQINAKFSQQAAEITALKEELNALKGSRTEQNKGRDQRKSPVRGKPSEG